jgi:hypothetical protein
MAWDMAARKRLDGSKTVTKKVAFMCDWWREQTAARSLFGAAA